MAIPKYDSDSRALAHRIVDAMFDHVADVARGPVVEWKTPDELRDLVRLDAADSSPVPGTTDAVDLLNLIARFSNHLHHPSYMGHQVCPPFPIAAAADFAISVLNQSTAVWEMSPIGTMIEKEIVGWLARRVGFPETFEGTAVSGGSAANLTALLAARASWSQSSRGERPVILTSADAHYSIARAAAIMGIDAEDVIRIPTDDHHRMDLGELAATLESVEELDASVLAIVATAGSTATGSFDDLESIGRLRDRHETWLHVDASHGASVLLSDSLRHLVAGLDHADSLAWDPHKMLWMPLSLGVVLVRDGRWMRRAFDADAPYLFHATRASENIGEITIQCSKRADAVKLWLTLKTGGTAPLTESLDKVTAMTRYLFERVRDSEDFEPMHEPQFNIFCFRYRGPDALNDEIRERLIRSGEAWITSTLLKGRRVLRVTMINPATEREHVDAMIESVRRIAREVSGEKGVPVSG
jgi:L-2,4-diaminobutyrate decarboxylase